MQDTTQEGILYTLNTDNLCVGAGKMFTLHKGVFVDPKLVYDATAKTTNLMLGVGLKF